jgi:sec-independent protein translocase protein TatC
VSAAADPDATGHMSIWEHLAELRSRLIKVCIAVVVGTVVGWFVFPYLLEFLKEPFNELQPDTPFIGTEPLQAFTLRLQMSVYIGIALAMPVIMWQLWRFITPALYPHEKKYAIPFTASAVVLFALGAYVAYLILNPTLNFLIDVGGDQIEPLYTAASYVNLVVFMMLAFGVGFEFPLVIVALQLIGVVTPRTLLGWWRPALLIVTVFAAVITPSGDPISMFALAAPMALLYFLSIAVGAVVLKLRRRKATKAARSEQVGADG